MRPPTRLRCNILEARDVPAASLVLDHAPGANEYGPDNLAADGDRLWFYLPNDQGVSPNIRNGSGFWTTDGTGQGTARVQSSYNPLNGVTLFAGRTVLIGSNGLYSSDGTAAGTTRIGPVTSDVEVFGDRLLFAGQSPSSQTAGTGGQELWVSDGTAAGTAQVVDLYPGGKFVTQYGGRGGPVRRWVANSSSPAELTAVNGVAVFTATTGTTGRDLWRTDGTAAGTVLLKDIADATPTNLTRVGGAVFFAAGAELWATDGTAAGTARLKTLAAAPTGLTAAGGTLFFAVADELWKSDGTAAGTIRVAEAVPGPGGEPLEQLTPFADGIVFSAADLSAGRELWASDGTAAGTRRVVDLRPGAAGGVPAVDAGGDLTVSAGRVFFTADNGAAGLELWATDGTAAGTALVHDVNPGAGGSRPEELTDVAGVLYFTAFDPVLGRELRRTPADPRPGLTINGPAAAIVEGNTGTRSATFTVTLSAPAAGPVTVQYATADGSAVAGTDYVATAGTLTFAPGETVKTIAVPVIGDRVREYEEGFALALSAPAGANLHRATASATITDDEPVMSVTGGSVLEGGRNTTAWLEFTVTLSAATDIPLGLAFTTNTTYGAPTATAGVDYQQTSDTVTFAPGETTKTVRVRVFGDRTRFEGDEWVTLQVADPFDAVNPQYGFGTILNDD